MSLIACLGSLAAKGSNPTPAVPLLTYEQLQKNITGLLSLWTLAEDAGTTLVDVHGSRNGTYSGTVTFNAADLPQRSSGGAVSFGGTGSASVPHDAGMELAAFSIHFWVKFAATIVGGSLIAKRGAVNTEGLLQISQLDSRSLRVRFNDGVNNHFLDTAEETIAEGQVVPVCITADGTGFALYLSGVLVGKNTGYTGAWSANQEELHFAATPIDPAVDVVLDEVALFDRVLTEQEIVALAQTTTNPEAVGASYVVNEDATTILDVTANDVFVGSKAGLTLSIVNADEVVNKGHAVSVNGDNDIEFVASTVFENESVSFTYRITDPVGTSDIATVGVTIQDTVTPSGDLPFFGLYYGGGWPSAQNGEIRFQSAANTVFFYAERTGTVTGFQWAWRTAGQDSGYSDGDGGTFRIEIVEANASTRLPATGGAVIASAVGIQPGNPTASQQRFVEYDFTTTGQVTAGQPYCFRVINTHASPNSNYASQNAVRYYVWFSTAGDNFIEPGGGPGAGSILAASGGIRGNTVGGSIAKILGYAPHTTPSGAVMYPVPITGEGTTLRYRRLGGWHATLRYSDGLQTLWGRGSGNHTNNTENVTGSTWVRQRFRVTRATRTVSGVFIMGWVSGTSGSLRVRLETGPENDTHAAGNGSLVEEVTVPASNFLNAGPTLTHDQFQGGSSTALLELVHYVWVPFTQNRTLTLGNTYNLVLEPNGCNFFINAGARGDDRYSPLGRNVSTWSAWEAQRKISWASWEDSRGPQMSTNAGSTWAYLPSSTQQQLPITFKCV